MSEAIECLTMNNNLRVKTMATRQLITIGEAADIALGAAGLAPHNKKNMVVMLAAGVIEKKVESFDDINAVALKDCRVYQDSVLPFVRTQTVRT